MTLEPTLAHLNGGPHDDQKVVLPPGFTMYRVAGRLVSHAGTPFSDSIGITDTRTGIYLKRLGFANEPVPHDLEGYVEFDWQGWDK